jgi:hypothetical protein
MQQLSVLMAFVGGLLALKAFLGNQELQKELLAG